MVQQDLEKNGKRGRLIRFSVLIGTLYVLYSCVLMPLTVWVESNIAYAGTMIPDLLELAYKVVDLTCFFLTYAFMIAFVFQYHPSGTWPIIWIFSATDLLRYTLNLLISAKTDGNLSVISDGILFVVLYWLLEVVQLLLLFGLTSLFWRNWYAVSKVMDQVERSTGRPVERGDCLLFPFHRIWNWRNPVQRSALCAGIVTTGLRWLSRMIYDIGYGAPTDFLDVTWMVVYYVLDAVIGVVGYLAMLGILRVLFRNKATQGNAADVTKKG
mgnify:CR=1 FL=1